MLNRKFLLLVAILAVTLFLRFYQITEIPNGFNQDESAIGYNAYSILQTGRDEHGEKFPIYFKSFGDYKLPAYIYMTAVSERIFGLNEFAVRFPSALLGSLTVLMIFFVVFYISDNKKLAFLTSFLLAINPWHLFFSRASFETNAALAFAVFGMWMFLVAIRSKRWFYLLPAILGFVISLYSYNVTRLLAPVLLSGLIWMNWREVREIPRKIIFGAFGFFIILLLPFIFTFLSPAGASSAQGALITSTDIQAKNLEMRSYLAESAGLVGKMFFNNYVFIVWQYFQNLVGSLSFNFFFISGSPHGSQGIGNMGVFYLLEFPLIIVGVIAIFIAKMRKLYFFVLWAVIALMTLSLSKEVPHATRGYFLVIPLEVFSALGLLTLIQYIQKIKIKTVQIVLVISIISLCGYNLIYYFSSYYYRFPTYYAKGWRQQDKALTEYIKSNENKYDKIIIDKGSGFAYTSFLFFSEYSPEKFLNTVVRNPDDVEGWSDVKSFGKYEWKNVEWEKEQKTSKTLIIVSENKVPTTISPIAIFRYPQRPVVLSVKEQIVQYPTQDTAYVAVEIK